MTPHRTLEDLLGVLSRIYPESIVNLRRIHKELEDYALRLSRLCILESTTGDNEEMFKNNLADIFAWTCVLYQRSGIENHKAERFEASTENSEKAEAKLVESIVQSAFDSRRADNETEQQEALARVRSGILALAHGRDFDITDYTFRRYENGCPLPAGCGKTPCVCRDTAIVMLVPQDREKEYGDCWVNVERSDGHQLHKLKLFETIPKSVVKPRRRSSSVVTCQGERADRAVNNLLDFETAVLILHCFSETLVKDVRITSEALGKWLVILAHSSVGNEYKALQLSNFMNYNGVEDIGRLIKEAYESIVKEGASGDFTNRGGLGTDSPSQKPIDVGSLKSLLQNQALPYITEQLAARKSDRGPIGSHEKERWQELLLTVYECLDRLAKLNTDKISAGSPEAAYFQNKIVIVSEMIFGEDTRKIIMKIFG
jgi:hypothetical protein